jgi:hypothetical protein
MFGICAPDSAQLQRRLNQARLSYCRPGVRRAERDLRACDFGSSQTRNRFSAPSRTGRNRLTIQLMAVMAEHESRLISERTKAAMAAAKARGATFGASPETLPRATAASLRARRLRASNTESKSA